MAKLPPSPAMLKVLLGAISVTVRMAAAGLIVASGIC